MNKTLIAAAVSAALMVPVAAQADVTVYGRIHQGIWFSDTDGKDSTTDLESGGSRFGIKASSDLGNGLTASAHYEFSTSVDKPGTGVVDTRIGTVGLSGGFGSITAGNQWGAYYNNAALISPTYEGLELYYLLRNTEFRSVYRTANTVSYSNSFGPVSFQLDSRIDDSASKLDGYAVGATVAVNDMITVSAAIDDGKTVTPATKDTVGVVNGATGLIKAKKAKIIDRTLTALQAKFSLGNYWASISRHSVNPEDDDRDPSINQFWVGGSFGNTSAMVGAGSGDYDNKGDVDGNSPGAVTLGVYHDMGGGLTLMYEGLSFDGDSDPENPDKTVHWFGMMYNF